MDLNLSEVFEAAAIEALRRKRQEGWLAENRAAIEASNALVASDGLLSDAWRKL